MRLISRTLGMAAVVAVASAFSAGLAQGQATATVCKDGTTSATSGRGACSGHGGVNATATKAAEKSAKKAAKAASKAEPKAAPASAMAAGAASVTCSDGSMSRGGRGACSGHGGVKAGATAMAAPAPAKPAPARPAPAAAKVASHATVAGSGAKEDNNPTGAIAKCKDGLYSHATHRQGACSGHGGVASWS